MLTGEVRFKYDVYADSAASQAAAGRDAFATDIATTINPNHTIISSNDNQFVQNGKLAANRVTVSGTVDLTTLLIDSTMPGLGTFGALLPGQTAYFRWQISNAYLNNGNRSALGIDNFGLTALAAGAEHGQLASLSLANDMATPAAVPQYEWYRVLAETFVYPTYSAGISRSSTGMVFSKKAPPRFVADNLLLSAIGAKNMLVLHSHTTTMQWMNSTRRPNARPSRTICRRTSPPYLIWRSIAWGKSQSAERIP